MTLREVIVDIARRSKMLDEQDADEKLRRCIRLVEFRLRTLQVNRILKVPIEPGITLGWSSRKGAWRLVIVDDQEAVPLLDTEPDEIVQVFTTGAIAKLVEQAAA